MQLPGSSGLAGSKVACRIVRLHALMIPPCLPVQVGLGCTLITAVSGRHSRGQGGTQHSARMERAGEGAWRPHVAAPTPTWLAAGLSADRL